jgi:predicted transposase/invertase (TIGR01784 family)
MLLTEWNQDEAIEVAREEAYEDGREEGLADGLEKGVLMTARNALEEGASVDFVQKITGLSLDTIEKLQN